MPARAWTAGADPDPGLLVVDVDGTLLDAHSDKQGAEGTYKGGFGFYPLLAFLDRAMAPARRWQGSYGPATPAPTPPATTSRWSTSRWLSSPPPRATRRSWSAPTPAVVSTNPGQLQPMEAVSEPPRMSRATVAAACSSRPGMPAARAAVA
jgi:hypothetical protein